MFLIHQKEPVNESHLIGNGTVLIGLNVFDSLKRAGSLKSFLRNLNILVLLYFCHFCARLRKWQNFHFGWSVPKRKTGGGRVQTVKIPTDRKREFEGGVLCKLSQSSVLDECNLMLSSDRECGSMGLCWYWITAGRKAQNLSTQSTTLSAEALQHGRNMAYSLYVPEQPRNWSMYTRTHTQAFIIDLPITAETSYRASMHSFLIPTAYQCHYLRPVFPPLSRSLK